MLERIDPTARRNLISVLGLCNSKDRGGRTQTRLNDSDFALDESEDGDDQLGDVSKRRVEKTSEDRSDTHGHLLRREREKGRERNLWAGRQA